MSASRLLGGPAMTEVILNFRSEREDITLWGEHEFVEGEVPVPRVGERISRGWRDEYRVTDVLYDYEGDGPIEVWITLAPISASERGVGE